MTRNEGNSTNARFGFTQSTKKMEYFINVFIKYKSLCTENIKPHTKFFATKGTNLTSINFATRRLPCLNMYHDLFYKDGKKEVPSNIADFLAPIGIAYWIIDDGSKQNRGLHLNVYGFNEDSINNLLITIEIKYKFKCSVHSHKSGKRIYIFEESMPTVQNIVMDYIVPSIRYKLGLL